MRIIEMINIRRWNRRDEDYQLRYLEKCVWPGNRGMILFAAQHSKLERVRIAAVKKMPYPEAREPIVRIAKEDPEGSVREQAAELLHVPEDRDTLISIASDDPSLRPVLKAVRKLSRAGEKETLIRLAKGDHFPSVAVQELNAEEDRTVLEDILQHSADIAARRAAAEKLKQNGGQDEGRKEAEQNELQNR